MSNLNKRAIDCIHNLSILSDALMSELKEATLLINELVKDGNTILKDMKEIDNVILSKINEASNVDKVAAYNSLINKLCGPNSLFVQYLSPKMIEFGKGVIDVCETFKQYTPDCKQLPSSKLDKWPSGFYRNDETKDIQFLIKTDRFIVCVEGIPSMFANVFVYTAPFENNYELSNMNNLSNDDLGYLIESVEDKLKAITNAHNFDIKNTLM